MNFRVVTSRGWGWVVVALLCLVIGAAQGWIELIGLGIAGLVTFGVATLYALLRHSHEVSFHLAHHRVVVGDEQQLDARLVTEHHQGGGVGRRHPPDLVEEDARHLVGDPEVAAQSVDDVPRPSGGTATQRRLLREVVDGDVEIRRHGHRGLLL